jgi:hypothetical protein
LTVEGDDDDKSPLVLLLLLSLTSQLFARGGDRDRARVFARGFSPEHQSAAQETKPGARVKRERFELRFAARQRGNSGNSTTSIVR